MCKSLSLAGVIPFGLPGDRRDDARDRVLHRRTDGLKSFRGAGGAVILMGSAAAESPGVANLNALASALGSDLRLDGSAVTDWTNNLDRNERLPTTTQFADSFDLFGPYS